MSEFVGKKVEYMVTRKSEIYSDEYVLQVDPGGMIYYVPDIKHGTNFETLEKAKKMATIQRMFNEVIGANAEYRVIEIDTEITLQENERGEAPKKQKATPSPKAEVEKETTSSGTQTETITTETGTDTETIPTTEEGDV